MTYEYLSVTSSTLVIIGYIPEIYTIIKKKKSNVSNIPIWVIWLLSNGLGIIYCGLTDNYLIMINYSINFFFCGLTSLLNIYFFYNDKKIKPLTNNNESDKILPL